MGKTPFDKNGSGYYDPSAKEAMVNADEELQRIGRLMTTLKYICRLAGFDIEGRIVLKDRKTGKVWR